MSRPARLFRRPLLLSAFRAVLAGTLLVLASACSAPEQPDSVPGGAPAGAAAADPAAPVSYGIPQDVTAMVLPATGKDTRLTQGLEGFAGLVRSQSLRDCLATAHTPVPDMPPPMFIRLFEIPDTEAIARNGFQAGVVPAPAPSPPPAPSAKADDAVVQRCTKQGDAAAAELRSVYGPLLSRWLLQLAPLEQDGTVVSARKSFTACLAGKGVQAKDENGFFDGVDRKLRTIDDRDAVKAEDRRLGAIYAACIGPVESAREPLRAHLREQFAAEHQAELEKVRGLPGLVTEMEKRYTIRFSVPTTA
ncbi:hypothetical protein ACIRBY_15375 [Streptomyces sp. NPDC096136]|uniref:hypothetical protein n=1 Tax=Streptomyces sp. NPDC096136 TaxID=3366076 RepID=UPI0037F1418D